MRQSFCTARSKTSSWFALAMWLFVNSMSMADSVLYVDDDAPLADDGANWATAFQFLNDAIAVANPPPNQTITIRVAQGTYLPDHSEANPNGSGDRFATFELKDAVTFQGGYAGIGAEDPDELNIDLFESVLSGDLAGDDGPDFNQYGENSFHVVTGSHTDATAVMDGLTIKAGNASGIKWGGGMIIDSGSPIITDCIFVDNMAGNDGGAVVMHNWGSPVFTRCLFLNNIAVSRGGGIYTQDFPNPSIVDCSFLGNQAFDGGGMNNGSDSHSNLSGCVFGSNVATNGGGLTNSDTSATLVDCTFEGNTAQQRGGGVYYNDTGTGSCTGCTFRNNFAHEGGAVNCHLDSHVHFLDCRFTGNTAFRGGGINIQNYSDSVSAASLINCVIFHNAAEDRGGALYNIKSDTIIINCTIVKNSAAIGNAIFNSTSSKPTIFNSIIRGNQGQPFGGAGSPIIRYSNVYPAYPGAGNITASPKFVDASIGDLRLRAGSPCIDAGKNNALPNGTTTDSFGNPRFVDDPNTPNTGVGTGPIVDVGAFEFVP